MSRKSKRGFKKLQDHELAELASVQPGSDSEVELDLRGDLEPDHSAGGCGTSCCWCIALYLVLLTCLVLLLGAFSGYLAYNLWSLSDKVNSNYQSWDGKISKLAADVKSTQSRCNRQYSAMGHTIMDLTDNVTDLLNRINSLNASVRSLQAVVNPMSNTVTRLDETSEDKFQSLNDRLKKIEDSPHLELIEQVDAIHNEMRLLNGSMSLLSQSLSDVQNMRTQMASMSGMMESYDSQLLGLHRDLGDLTNAHTTLEEKVGGLSEDLAGLQGKVDDVEKAITTSHEQMQQSSDLLSNQFTNVQVVVSALNDSLSLEVGQLWTNLTGMEARVKDVADEVETLMKEVETLSDTQPEPQATSIPKEESVTPPATQPPAENATSAEQGAPPEATTAPETTPKTTPETTPPSTTAAEATAAEIPESSTDSADTAESPTPQSQPDESPSVDHSDAPERNQSSGTDSTGATEDVPANEEEAASNGTKSDVGDKVSTGTDGAQGTPDSTSATEDRPNVGTPTATNRTDSNSSFGQMNVSSTEPDPAAQSEAESQRGESIRRQEAIQALAGLLERFGSLDINKDGVLTVMEFSMEFSIYADSIGIFHLLDQNHDGGVSYEEISGYLQSLRRKELAYEEQRDPYGYSYSDPENNF